MVGSYYEGFFKTGCTKCCKDTDGKSLLSNQAAHEPALSVFGKIASAAGAKLACVNSFSRVDRGVGQPAVERVPYFPDQMLKWMKQAWTQKIQSR